MSLTVKTVLGGVCTIALTACADEPRTKEQTAPAQSKNYGQRDTARIHNNQGERIGDVTVWQMMDGVLISIDVRELPPGGHGLHMHQTGDCSDTGGFKLSSSHIARQRRPTKFHGDMHPTGTHAGDLPNLYVNGDGQARIDVLSVRISLDDLRDRDGAALVIHANPDDYQTQQTGSSGPRIACAAFKSKAH